MARSKLKLPEAFCSEVEQRFGFLVGNGFAEPRIERGDRPSITYRGAAFSVLCAMDHEGIVTYVETDLGKPNEGLLPRYRAGLSCLYVSAGVGSAQALSM